MRLIDADALKAYLRRPYSNEEMYTNTDIEHIINNLPTVEERPHGEWITKPNSFQTFCSNCDKAIPYSDEYDFSDFIFCPNCGADMRKSGETE